MATKEEIREGIYNIIRDNCQSASGWVGNKAETMELIMQYLDSQGVVIKVERKLPCPEYSPIPTMDEGYNMGYERGFQCGVMGTLDVVIKSGCGFFEPLIQEGK